MRRSADQRRPGAGGRHDSPWRAAGTAAVAALALTGVSLITVAVNAGSPAPPRPAADAAAAAGPEPTVLATAMATGGDGELPLVDSWSEPPAMTRSEPTSITIARIEVRARVVPLGLNADRTPQVPSLAQAELAGWYRLGPSPGEIGNSVIVGHVDSAALGPAVFYLLGKLRPGDTVEVARKDGSVARFTVDRVASYPKSAFPSDLVYGDADRAQLRLVTCGGRFDGQRRTYLDNIVVLATLDG